MQTEQYTEFKIVITHEPPDGGTQYYEHKGRGNGQAEYAVLRERYPRDEITINTREVVLTVSEWKKQKPDEICSGSGYAHSAHGQCEGYTTDRT